MLWRRVANSVGNVDGGGASFNDGLDDLAKKLGVSARSVLGRKLDVIDDTLGKADGINRELYDLLVGAFELVL